MDPQREHLPAPGLPILERVHPECVTPLEVWDLVVEGTLISERMNGHDLPRLLLEAIRALVEGRAVTRGSPISPLRACKGSDFVFVGGGGALRPGLAHFLSSVGVPVLVSSEGPFVAEAGGWELLRPYTNAGLVVDLGQTAIKVSLPGARFVYPRDLSALPFSGGMRSLVRVGQRARLISFISGAIQESIARSGFSRRLEAGVFALPCEVDDSGAPGSSSYTPFAGDRNIIPEACAKAGLGSMSVMLVNDAELAAVTARLHPAVRASRKALVLTLGSGLGGALVDESNRPGLRPAG